MIVIFLLQCMSQVLALHVGTGSAILCPVSGTSVLAARRREVRETD